jgi:hypothetical protein
VEMALPKLLYASEMVGCGATLELDSKETCLISVARRTGVRVKGSQGRFGRFWIGFSGSILYEEKNAYKITQMVENLNSLFSDRVPPIKFRNPALTAFTNAVWHLSSAAEVIWKLNEAAAPAEASPTKSSAELLGAVCDLMERHPTSLLDSCRLPASKQKIKAAIKEVWHREPKLRHVLAQLYLYLSHFQDGIGGVPPDCKPPSSGVAPAETCRERLTWQNAFLSEMELLHQEWSKFLCERDSAG